MKGKCKGATELRFWKLSLHCISKDIPSHKLQKIIKKNYNECLLLKLLSTASLLFIS